MNEGGGDQTQLPHTITTNPSSDSNVLSNGEQGRNPPRVAPNSNSQLDFGWFSLPREDGTKTDAPQQASRPGTGCVSGRGPRGSRPPSQSGRNSRPGSQSRRMDQGSWNAQQAGAGNIAGCEETGGMDLPPSRGGGGGEQLLQVRPPSGQQYAQQVFDGDPMCGAAHASHSQSSQSQRLVVEDDDPSTAGFERQGYDRGPEQHHQGQQAAPSGPTAEIQAVDWPLSRVAQMMMRPPPAEPATGTFGDKGWEPGSARPRSRDRRSNVPPTPPTPMPPLTWVGHKGGSRPTYASWREQWHRDYANSQHECQQMNNNARPGGDTYSDFNNNSIDFNTDDNGNSNNNSSILDVADFEFDRKCDNNNNNNMLSNSWCTNNDDAAIYRCNDKADIVVCDNIDDNFGTPGADAHGFSPMLMQSFGINGSGRSVGRVFCQVESAALVAAFDGSSGSSPAGWKVFGEDTATANGVFLPSKTDQVSWIKKASSTKRGCWKRLKKRGATVDPLSRLPNQDIKTALDGIRTCYECPRDNELAEVTNGGSAASVTADVTSFAEDVIYNPRLSLTDKINCQLQTLRGTASKWWQRMSGNGSKGVTYSQFENDH